MDEAELDLGEEAVRSAAAKFAMAVLGFVGIIIFARVLGSVRLGRYYLILTISQVLVQFVGGFGGTIRKRVSEVGTDPGEFLGAGLLIHGLFLFILVPVAFVSSNYLPESITSIAPPTEIAAMIVVLAATIGVFSVFNQFYSGLGYPSRAIWLDGVRSVFTLGLQLLFIWAGYGSLGLLAGVAIASLIAAVIVAIIAGVMPEVPSKDTLHSIIDFARWNVPTSILTNIYDRVDPVLLGILVSSTAVGYYETAARLGMPAMLLASSISNPLSVKISRKTSIGESIADNIRNSISYTSLLSIPMFFGALALDRELMVTVYGPDFIEAGPFLIGVILFYTIRTFHLPLGSALYGSDRPRSVTITRLISLLVYIPVAVATVDEYGAFGIIYASIVAEIVMALGFEYASTEIGGPFFPVPILAQIASGIGMYTVIIALRPVYTISGWLTLLAVVCSGALVYFSLLPLLSRHFRMTVINVADSTLPVEIPVQKE